MKQSLTLINIMLFSILSAGCATTPYNPPSEYSLPASIPSAQTDSVKQAQQLIKMPQLVCAEQWVPCKVQAAGSLVQSTRKGSLTTFWKTSCSCSSDCGCIDGLAYGEGFARWCDTTNLCEGDLYGAVSGKLSNGKYVEQNGKILVSINSRRGFFRGEINSDGSYAVGIMEQPGCKEKFIGLLNESGYYKSGALYIDNKIILANRFDGKKPLGRVFIGDSNGNFTENNCDNYGCRAISSNYDNLISDLFKMLAGNKAEEIATRGALRLIGKEVLLMHPVFRTFSFLSDAIEVFELVDHQY